MCLSASVWECLGMLVACQFVCSLCGLWKNVKLKHGTVCEDCRYEQRRLKDYPPLPPSPSPSPSPSRSMFDRPSGCIDQLTLIERAAIITLHAVGWTGREIAQDI